MIRVRIWHKWKSIEFSIAQNYEILINWMIFYVPRAKLIDLLLLTLYKWMIILKSQSNCAEEKQTSAWNATSFEDKEVGSPAGAKNIDG